MWWLSLATAAPLVNAGLEVQPDAWGRVEERALLELIVEEPVGPVDVLVVGGARVWSGDDAGVLPMVQRLLVQGDVAGTQVLAGRFVERDERGSQRIDGVFVDHQDEDSDVWMHAWGGRLWRPEIAGTPFGDGTWVAGFEAGVRPERVGGTSWWVSGSAGTELRLSPVPTGRLFGAMHANSPRGDRLLVFGEADAVALDGKGRGLRGLVEGEHPVGPRIDAVYEARWEGVRRAAIPDAEDGPLEWIAPNGYGTGEIGFRAHGALATSLSVSPMFRPEPGGGTTNGGAVRAAVRVREGVDVFARAAAVGTSRFYGGGLVANTRIGASTWTATGACWGLGPLDDRPRLVGEVRLRGDVPIGDTGWGVVGQVRAGTDRLLPGWLRGGVLLRAPLGGGGR